MKVLVAGVVVGLSVAAAAARPPSSARVPVVLELFTSEGCSSCPPADAVLSKLAREQSVPGVEIVPLGMHVTYWDQLGWKDAASLAGATARQQGYGRVFGEDRIYTPQAVIDGRDELVGSDEAGVRRAIERAGRRPHAHVTVSAQRTASGSIVAHVNVSDVPADLKEPLQTTILITEDGLTSVVMRGENGGRTLQHDAVVRVLSSSAEIRNVSPAWNADRLHVVAVVQGERSQRIAGAATARIQ